MIIRNYTEADFDKYLEISSQHKQKFFAPDLANKNIFGHIVAEKDGQIIGFGLGKTTAEIILVLDKNCSVTERTHAVEGLFRDGKMITVKKGLDSWHVFVKDDPEFVKFLQDYFHFKVLDETCLYLGV